MNMPVSILVFVELALDDYGTRERDIQSGGFQSLFSWNLLLMGIKMDRFVLILFSFNPCFRGTCSWWSISLTISHTASSFNPCFRGTCSWWKVLQSCPPALNGVSILVFVELALDGQWGYHPRHRVYDSRYGEFQSLFSWNLLLMQNIVHPHRKSPAVFQSLFSWNLLLMN